MAVIEYRLSASLNLILLSRALEISPRIPVTASSLHSFRKVSGVGLDGWKRSSCAKVIPSEDPFLMYFLYQSTK